MKILLRPRLTSQALGHRLAADPGIAPALGPERNAAVGFLFKKFFDAHGPVLPRVLAHAQAVGEGMSFLRDLQFTPAEIAGASHLEAVCRKTVGQTKVEASTTLDEYDAAALHATGSRWQVRLPERVYLTKPVLPGNISHVDQYTGEFVLGARAAQALRASELTGWQLRPVVHWKTREPLPEVAMHLTTAGLLPSALEGGTAFETFDDGPRKPSTPRRLGVLRYAPGALEQSLDFARTAEPWCEWCTPQWVVRQRVREWYAQAGLKGWAFWPVLEAGTALHDDHESKWAELLSRLKATGSEIFA